MPGDLGPHWDGWARFSASYTEAVNDVLKNRRRKKPKKRDRIKKAARRILRRLFPKT